MGEPNPDRIERLSGRGFVAKKANEKLAVTLRGRAALGQAPLKVGIGRRCLVQGSGAFVGYHHTGWAEGASHPRRRGCCRSYARLARGRDRPVAMPPGRDNYNVDALRAKIGAAVDEAKLVQLDRLRVGQQRLSLRELADAFGHTGRTIINVLTARS
jgi:hypothetical protein